MKPEEMIRKHAIGLCAALIVQYLLGMAINMYVQFPEGLSVGNLWEFSGRQLIVVSHIGLAMLLFAGSIDLVARAYRIETDLWKVPAWIGFAAIILAGFGGSWFIPTQQDPYSYLMVVGFIVAFSAYGWGLYRSK